MAFNVSQNTQNGNGGTRKEIDWNALQRDTIDAAKTASRARSIPGVISGIIDLGVQKRPDAEKEFKGNDEDELKAIKENPKTYFKDKGGKRYQYTPLKDVQCVAITVDFPQIMVDKGKYFGNSNPAPLRLILNGEMPLSMITFKDEDKKVRILQKGFALSEVKRSDGKWSFDPKNTLHKLAAATGELPDTGIFKPAMIDRLLGKAAQFEFRVYMKPSKTDASKTFYTEEIKLAGMIPEGVNIPTLADEYLSLVQFTEDNDPTVMKHLRGSIVNTIKRANDYAGSKIQVQLDAIAGEKSQAPKGDKPANTPAKPAPQADDADNVPDFDDDAPF